MNEQEFNQKVVAFSGKFYGYSRKILGDREEARDTVQELYLKLWLFRDSLRNINNIEAFATTIIRNLCLDRLKKKKSVALQSENYVRLSTSNDFFSGDSLDDEVEIKVDLVRRAISKLPEIQQKVFVMRDFEEKEFDEISRELNLTHENLRVILSRARKRIRELVNSKKEFSND